VPRIQNGKRRHLSPSAPYAGMNRIRFEGTRVFHDLSHAGAPGTGAMFAMQGWKSTNQSLGLFVPFRALSSYKG